jgi:hypothetical protein
MMFNAHVVHHTYGPEGIPTLRNEPAEVLEPGLLLFFTAASLVWSARAFSYFLRDRVYRNSLRRMSRSLGITDELRPSETYLKRRARARKRTPASSA